MNKCRLKPLDDRCVILPDEPAGKSVGGIIIPDSAKDKPQRGKVVAVGPGKRIENLQFSSPSYPDGMRHKMAVKVGDTVLYCMYAGSDIEDDGKTFKVVHENEIIGVVE